MPRAPYAFVLAPFLAACVGAQAPVSSGASPRRPQVALDADAGAATADASGIGSAPDAQDGPATTVAGSGADAPPAADGAMAAGPPVRTESASSLVTIDLGIPHLAPPVMALVVNVDALRATSVSPALASIAATSSSMRDIVNSDLHVDWALVSGPSIDRTGRDVAILRCGTDDAAIDRWLDAVAARSKGGPLPLSVPDVHAVTANLDSARVLMRVQPHVLAIVPPDVADDAAHALVGASLPDRVEPREALRFRLKKSPTQSFPDFVAPAVTELRVWFEPGPGPTVDAFVEEDTPTPAAATKAVDAMREWLRDKAQGMVSISTGGLFDHVDLATRARVATAHLHATREQVATTIALISGNTGAGVPRNR